MMLLGTFNVFGTVPDSATGQDAADDYGHGYFDEFLFEGTPLISQARQKYYTLLEGNYWSAELPYRFRELFGDMSPDYILQNYTRIFDIEPERMDQAILRVLTMGAAAWEQDSQGRWPDMDYGYGERPGWPFNCTPPEPQFYPGYPYTPGFSYIEQGITVVSPASLMPEHEPAYLMPEHEPAYLMPEYEAALMPGHEAAFVMLGHSAALSGRTQNSVTIHAQFPVSGASHNQIQFRDPVTGTWRMVPSAHFNAVSGFHHKATPAAYEEDIQS